MKQKEEELDKLFKKKADDPANEPVYREADWEAMEHLLDQQKKRGGIIYWLPRLGSVAAVLLLGLFAWLLFKPQPASQNNNGQQVVKIHSKPDTGISGVSGRRETADSSKQKNTPANLAQNSDHPGAGKKTNRSYPYLPDGRAAKMPVKAPANVFAANNALVKNNKKDIGQADLKKDNNVNTLAANNNAVATDKKDIGHVDVKGNDNTNSVTANTISPTGDKKDDTADGKNNGNANSLADNTAKPKVKVKGTSNGANRAIFAITAIASSDMNGTGTLNGGSRLGGNLGALFSVSSGKWTLSAGGMYSIKPYQESFADYHTPYQFQTTPSTVGVNCRMIDIPLNLNYQVYRKGVNKFTVGTGLSSYIILREDYTFNYANTYYNYGTAGYSVVNRNRNIMSILNLDATYERQINSKFGLILQPYLKLPLSNVGASQVKLQSTGVAVGLSWNLNSFKKPN